MNASEAAVLLARISASDNREVSEAAARAWAESLPDVELRDALEYLPTFYRTATRDTKNWIYPGDVLNGVRELFDQRRRAVAENARRLAIEAATPEEREERGEIIGARAAGLASREWVEQNPLPGAEIDAKKQLEEDRRAFRNMWGVG